MARRKRYSIEDWLRYSVGAEEYLVFFFHILLVYLLYEYYVLTQNAFRCQQFFYGIVLFASRQHNRRMRGSLLPVVIWA